MTLAVTTVTVVTLAAASATTLLLVRRDELHDLDRALFAQAHLVARLVAMTDPLHPILTAGSAEIPEHYEPSTQYVAVYDASGVPLTWQSFTTVPRLSELGVRGHPPQDGVSIDLEESGRSLRGVVIPMRRNQGYSLLYAASRAEVDADVVFLTRLHAVLLVVATVLTTIVARWLGRRLSSDVQELAAIARTVARGDLEARSGGRVRGSTETRELASDLDHMVSQLSALVVAQRTFISHAAHELMSPLATLRGELQLALRRPRSVHEHEDALNQALDDVQALVTLSEDLLTLARAETSKNLPAETLLMELVADASRAAKGGAMSRGVAIIERQGEPSTRAARVIGARRELSRALRNLLDNAVSHSNPGQSVAVVVTLDGEEARIAVEDGGPGVAPADREAVFEPFFRGSRERGETDQGVGLGLAIARQIARRSGGEVELDGGFGPPGARFTLRVRRVPRRDENRSTQS
ncbi:MAG TPA: HAMP domain-containing sensor histidine kinase [Polyangiaceae bacterium]|nr:HAMP domain-containing sensor histidine kinase [Polyangiaceae bacterium]